MNGCWIIEELEKVRVAIVYVHVVDSPHYQELSKRFVRTYQQFPPGHDHKTVIVCNGGNRTASTDLLFEPLPNRVMMQHDNSGRDIGAFQMAALKVPCDLMVFFGGSTYFRRSSGWLARMVESYRKHGPTLYGSTGHTGTPQLHVYPHIRTTAFWMPPALMNAYPHRVRHDNQRYPFEHGRDCLTDWIARNGMVPLIVGWHGEYPWEQWASVPNGYHNGDQSNVLVGDRLTEPPYWHAA